MIAPSRNRGEHFSGRQRPWQWRDVVPLCAQIDGTLPQGNSCQTTDTCLRLRSAQLLAEQRKLRRSGEWERRVGSGNGTVRMRVSVFRLRVELLPMANGGCMSWRGASASQRAGAYSSLPAEDAAFPRPPPPMK